MVEYSELEIRESLSRLGVKNGDCIFVHSGLKSLGRYIPKSEGAQLKELLDLFLDIVGSNGTVVVPTFNFAFCHGADFDRQRTPCDGMGVFAEHVRLDQRSKRSKHPFHSVSAVGKSADLISEAAGDSEFSDGSSFDVLLKLKCKGIFYGVPFVETFVHISEERAKVPYRFWKTFSGYVVDGNLKEKIAVKFYARKLDAKPVPRLDKPKLNSFLREKGVILSTGLGAGEISVFNSVELVNCLTEKFRAQPEFALICGKQSVG